MFTPQRTREVSSGVVLSHHYVMQSFDAKSEMTINTVVDPETYTRKDGRFPEQLRPLSLSAGPLSKAAGSAFITVGQQDCQMVVSVTPPRPALRSRVFKALGSVECRVRTVMPPVDEPEGCREELGRQVSETIQIFVNKKSFPNAFIIVDVLVLNGHLVDDRECILSAAINGAGLALANAGIEMLSVPCCLSFALLHSSMLIMDPTGEERKCLSNSPKGIVAVSMLGDGTAQVANIDIQGVFEEASLVSEVTRQVVEGATVLYQECIRPSYESIK